MTTYGLACLWNEYQTDLHRYALLQGIVMKAPTPKTETDVIDSVLQAAGYRRSDDDLKPLPNDAGGPEREPLPVYERWTDNVLVDQLTKTKQVTTVRVCEKAVVGPTWVTFYVLVHKGEMDEVKSIKRVNLNAIRQYVREG